MYFKSPLHLMKKLLFLLNKTFFPASKEIEEWFRAVDQPVYGAKVFFQKSWMEKQIEESMRRKSLGLY